MSNEISLRRTHIINEWNEMRIYVLYIKKVEENLMMSISYYVRYWYIQNIKKTLNSFNIFTF